MQYIYLDNAATTRPDPCAVEAMLPWLTEQSANAGSRHAAGRKAGAAVSRARESVRLLFGAQEPEQIAFTSGGSEANNMVFHGLTDFLRREGKTHILLSAGEHESVRRAAYRLRSQGFDVQTVPITENGAVSVGAVKSMLRKNTGLVSVMYVNNETGAVNPVEEIGTLCSARSVLFHTDCVQAAGVFDLSKAVKAADFATISAHKLHGAQGVGALYIRAPGAPDFVPLIFGGKAQEHGLRAGTENVAGIVAMGVACDKLLAHSDEYMCSVMAIKQGFYANLIAFLERNRVPLDTVHVNGAPVVSQSRILNLRFDGVDGESLLMMLSAQGIFVSAGSACTSGSPTPSHVLRAMGLTDEQARSSVRISFSRYNTEREAEHAAAVFADCIAALRERAGL